MILAPTKSLVAKKCVVSSEIWILVHENIAHTTRLLAQKGLFVAPLSISITFALSEDNGEINYSDPGGLLRYYIYPETYLNLKPHEMFSYKTSIPVE